MSGTQLHVGPVRALNRKRQRLLNSEIGEKLLCINLLSQLSRLPRKPRNVKPKSGRELNLDILVAGQVCNDYTMKFGGIFFMPLPAMPIITVALLNTHPSVYIFCFHKGLRLQLILYYRKRR